MNAWETKYLSPFLKPTPKGDKLLPQSCRNNWQYVQDKPDQLQGNMSLYQYLANLQSVSMSYNRLTISAPNLPIFSPQNSYYYSFNSFRPLAQTTVSIHSFMVPKHFLPIKARADNPEEETEKTEAKKSNQNTIYWHYVTHQ